MKLKKIRKIYVEITNICNMKCSFCPETKRAKAFMSAEQFEHIAKQISPYTDYIYLHVKGEPLLHPNLVDILNICEKYNLLVNISTNGTLLKDREDYLKNIRQINISLHSFEKTDEQALNSYLLNIANAVDNLTCSGVIVRYKLWNDSTKNNNEAIIRFLEQKYNTNIQNTSYNKDIKLKEQVFLSIKQPFKWPDMEEEYKEETTCYGLRNQLAILVDGTVVPCCVDNNGDINLGNIFNTTLEEILNTNTAQEIKKNFENNKCVHELCKKCEYRIGVT